MAWPWLDGMIKVVVTYGFDGQPSVNVHFVLQDTPVSPVPDAALLSVADAAWTAWDDNWKTRASDEWNVDDIVAYDWSREGGNVIQTDSALPILGGNVTAPVPANCAVVVSQRTNRTGRNYRGRNYVPGLATSTVTGNEVNADLMTDLSLIYSDFRTALGVLGMQQVVYSLFYEGEKRVTPEPTPISGTIVDSRVDTQRRRLPPMT